MTIELTNLVGDKGGGTVIRGCSNALESLADGDKGFGVGVGAASKASH